MYTMITIFFVEIYRKHSMRLLTWCALGVLSTCVQTSLISMELPYSIAPLKNELPHSDRNEAAANNSHDINNRYALITAAEHGDSEKVRFLLQLNTDVDVQDEQGNTALIMAARYGHIALLPLLLERGARLKNIPQKGHKSKKVLLVAVKHGHLPIVRCLLEWVSSAPARHYDYKNKALIYAQNYRLSEMEELLKSYGATTNPLMRCVKAVRTKKSGAWYASL